MKHIFAKRIFSMLLALVMVIGLLPLSALSVVAATRSVYIDTILA